MSVKNKSDWVIRARANHHDALKAMLPGGDMRSGVQVWRQLRRVESTAARLALRLCNGPELSEDEQEKIKIKIRADVEKILGHMPEDFFINLDPRGWALKLEKARPGMHKDWGGYGCLAPLIEA